MYSGWQPIDLELDLISQGFPKLTARGFAYRFISQTAAPPRCTTAVLDVG